MTGLRTAFDEATAAYEVPRVIRLAPNLYGVAFTLMKMIPARYILRKAHAEGRLEPATVIAETTSGTFGLALAMQGVHMGHRVILVSDPVIDERLYRRLTDLGAEVERVPAGTYVGGYQAARLERLAEVLAEYPASFCPEQYSNPDNPRSYAVVAELLVEMLGQVDCVVGPVGSGGSMCGTTTYLRSVLPDCVAIGVDTHGSVLFGQPDEHRDLRGLGMSMLPANLDHRVFDHVHWCSASIAYAATRELHRRHALYMGPTSGAAYRVADWWARRNPDAVTVVLMPDEGHRYQDTVYDDAWLAERGHLEPGHLERDRHGPGHLERDRLGQPVGEPVETTDPARLDAPWASFRWARRAHADVVPAHA